MSVTVLPKQPPVTCKRMAHYAAALTNIRLAKDPKTVWDRYLRCMEVVARWNVHRACHMKELEDFTSAVLAHVRSLRPKDELDAPLAGASSEE